MDEIHLWKVLVALGPETPADILWSVFVCAEAALLLLVLGWLIHWDWPRRHPKALILILLVISKGWDSLWWYAREISEFYTWGITALAAMTGLVYIALPLALLIAALGRHLRLRLLRPSLPPATPG